MQHLPHVHPAQAGHSVIPSHPASGHPLHPGVLDILNDNPEHIGGRSSAPFFGLAAHLGRHPSINLAAQRLLKSRAPNAQELTWVADHAAHGCQGLGQAVAELNRNGIDADLGLSG